MKKYLAYVIDTTRGAPQIFETFIEGVDYADIWERGRAAVDTGRRVDVRNAVLFTDEALKTRFSLHGVQYKFGAAYLLKAPKKGAIDAAKKAALSAILADAAQTPEAKLKAIAELNV